MILAILLLAGVVAWLALRTRPDPEPNRVPIPVRARERRPNRRR